MSSPDRPFRHDDVSYHPEDHSTKPDMMLSSYPMNPDVRSALYSTKLSSGQTRVIRLSKGAFQDAIEGSFEVVSLEGKGDYEALSWCWGNMNPETDPFITIDGFQYQIPKNLESALRHLRLPDKDRPLWCDAVSINQIDASEKARQVARMSEIYKNADHVLIWLGEGDSDSHLAMVTLNRFMEKLQCNDAGRMALSFSFEDFDQNRTILAKVGLDLPSWFREKRLVPSKGPFDPRPWIACSRLLKRSWFTRLWVIQEVYHNERRIFLHAGSDVSSLGALQLFAMSTVHIFDGEQMELLYESGYRIMRTPVLDSIWRLLDTTSTNTPPDPLLEILWQLRSQKCTVPHDRIYATLSMQKQLSINIDYTVPAWKVFRDLTVQIMTESRSLQALKCCMPSENTMLDCPSWVPDWSIDDEKRYSREISRWDDTLNRPRFCASGAREVEVVSLTERKLTARGVLFAIVTKRASSWSEALAFNNFKVDWNFLTPFLRGCRQTVMNANPDADFSVITQTLVAGSSRDLDFLPVKWEDAEPVALRLCDYNKHDGLVDGDEELAGWFYKYIRAPCTKRRLCIGDNGKPLLGPETTKVGDHVVLLFGSPVPLILRPVDPEQPELHQYTLVGECYVEGIMHGEYLEQNQTEFLDRRIFDFQLE